jgi:CheY-like chemotaxis protein
MTTERKKILIVDDDHLIRSILKKLLEFCDFECVIAANGCQAVEKWEQDTFQTILMDIDMPIMDGYTATKEIRQREIEEKRTYTPIIAVSGGDSTIINSQSAKVGMDGFIMKPFTKKELMTSISPFV